MIADDWKAWGEVLAAMCDEVALLERAAQENEWFTPESIRKAIRAMLPWFEGDQLAQLRNQYPVVEVQRRIGLILAGNLPLVGLHDVLMVLLSGHHAVIKPSHKDAVLLRHLVDQWTPELRAKLTWVEQVRPEDIDFLIATGSNATANQIEATFCDVPHLIRKSRFSVAVLDGNESEADWMGLAEDILCYHGMGCRSVVSILTPRGYNVHPLLEVLDRYLPHPFVAAWDDVVRYERAKMTMANVPILPCHRLLVHESHDLRPGGIGVLKWVTYADNADLQVLLQRANPEIQCVVGSKWTPFGQAQHPGLTDFADGVDTLKILTALCSTLDGCDA